jgi:hypothetical protein
MYDLIELVGNWGAAMDFVLPVEILKHKAQEEIRVNIFPGVAYVIGMTQKMDKDGLAQLQRDIQESMSPTIIGVIPEHVHPAIRVVALSLLVCEFVEMYLGIDHVITHGLCYMTFWYMMLRQTQYFETDDELESWWIVMQSNLFQRLAMTNVPIPENMLDYVKGVLDKAEGLVGDTLIEMLCATGGEVV